MNKEFDRKKIFFQIYNSMTKIRRAVSKCCNTANSKMMISPVQIHIVKLISENSEISIKEIVEKLNTTPSAVSQFIDRLAKIKIVERFNHKNDHRIVMVRLTKKGKLFMANKMQLHIKKMCEIFVNFNDRELIAYNKLNEKIFSNLKKINTNCNKGDICKNHHS